MAGTLSDLLRPAFLTVLITVLVSSDISEDFHVSYNVDSHPSHQQIVIEYEPLERGRYRRQAGVSNTSTVLPQVSTEQPTTKSTVTAAPSTPAPTVPNTSSPRPSTTAAPPPTTSRPITEPAPSATGSTTPVSSISEDNHQYYQSQIIPNAALDHWEDLSQAKKHVTLSKSHRTAVTIDLSFKFRFYGHNITNVTVATGGFLYVSPFLHQWLTATQYIAPLMANFDLRIGDESAIFYKDFGDKFAVQWRNVVLKDQNTTGSFDFQVQLHLDGTIKFLYRELPMEVSDISNVNHPVKIGLSDAFYIDTYLKEKGIRRRTIYEYHRVSFHGDQVDEGTVIVMSPLPTCNVITDCRDCINHDNVKFDCKWCGAVGRCSDGIDWHRSQWINSGCTNLALSNVSLCDVTTTSTTTTRSATSSNTPTSKISTSVRATEKTTTSKISTSVTATEKTTTSKGPSSKSHSGKCDGTISEGVCRGRDQGFPIGAVVAIILILLVVFGGIGVWIFYAYTHPTSASGMWLMEHRPSQMKAKIANIKFWKSSTPAGTKYAVESTA